MCLLTEIMVVVLHVNRVQSKIFSNCWLRKQGDAQPLAGWDVHQGDEDSGFLQQAGIPTAAMGFQSFLLEQLSGFCR